MIRYVYLFETTPGHFDPMVGEHPDGCRVIGACVNGEWVSVDELITARKHRDQESIIESMCQEAVAAPGITGMSTFNEQFNNIFGGGQ
jgi:hypothetical protein